MFARNVFNCLFFVFQSVIITHKNCLPMTLLEPRSSDVGSDRSATQLTALLSIRNVNSVVLFSLQVGRV